MVRRQLQTLRGWLFGNNGNCTLLNLQIEQISSFKVSNLLNVLFVVLRGLCAGLFLGWLPGNFT